MEKISPPVPLSVLALFAGVLLLLQLMSSATQESSELGEIYSWLVFINVVGSAVLLWLVGANIYTLARQLKKREAGSKLTTRMVALFVVLALAPAGIVFYFSMQFLHRGIDSWFNVEIDRAMEDALELGQASLDQRMRWHLKQTQQMAQMLEQVPNNLLALEIGNLREWSDAAEITLFSRPDKIIASNSAHPGDILPSLPDEQAWLQIRQNGSYTAFDPIRENDLMIRVIITLKADTPTYLQVLYAVPVRIADLADSVEFAFLRHKEMGVLRHSLKLSFSLALSLVLLMSLLAAIWVAFVSIRTIIAPVKSLVAGTQAVASGQYNQQLPVMAQDDLGFLVESFNKMTQRLVIARDQTRQATFETESQRGYLETILANLTAGVISFGADYKVRTANQAAYRIFRIPVSQFMGHALPELALIAPELAEPLKAMQRFLVQADDLWEQRIAFLGSNGRQELLCRGTPLFSQEGVRIGAVVVFDDVTDLIQAQKNAAWSEVARRLAHEIKNPLTPIQLSAERLQLKLADKLDSHEVAILMRSTRTIIQQVEAMKEMVDDFSEYARPAKKQAVIIDMAQLIEEVLSLYVLKSGVEFKSRFEQTGLLVSGDPVSIRQVLHNLLKNALEAIESKGSIEISLHRVQKNAAHFIELGLYDDGPGIGDHRVEQIFEPYVTTKAKGTGLGLAIVKKIVEEHGGAIWVDTAYKNGAGFILQFPAYSVD